MTHFSADDKDALPSLEAMRSKISDTQKKASRRDVGQTKDHEVSGTSLAMRFGIDVVSGVLVGAIAGYLVDKWLETKPVFFVICLLLGLAGGLLNIFRANARFVKALEAEEHAKHQQDKK